MSKIPALLKVFYSLGIAEYFEDKSVKKLTDKEKERKKRIDALLLKKAEEKRERRKNKKRK